MFLSDVREFRFQRTGIFSASWTALWVLFTIYFLWRIYQAFTGVLPIWLAPIPPLAIIYMWYMRLGSVETVTLAGDGRVTFQRVWGQRKVDALDVKSVRPWLGWSRKYFVLTHAHGFELLFEDPAQVARLVRELTRLNPEIEVRGVPPLPGEESSG